MLQAHADISSLSTKALGDLSAIGYSVKAAPIRFFFAGDKAPHFRCPPGTRRSGKWTDRLGTDCELGGARVALARIGERMQNIAQGEGGRGGKNPDLPSIGQRGQVRFGVGLGVGEGGGKKKPGFATALDRAADAVDGGKKKKRRVGVATRMSDLADVVDPGGKKRKKRGFATAMDDAADAVDGGAGKRRRRGFATALDDAADAVDGGAGKKRRKKRGFATALDDAADVVDPGGKKRRRRGFATAMDDAADAVDGGAGKRRRRGFATALDDAADVVDPGGKGKKRGVATALDDAADAVDGGAGKKKPRKEKKPKGYNPIKEVIDIARGGSGAPKPARRRRGETNTPATGTRNLEGTLPSGTNSQLDLPSNGRNTTTAGGMEASADVTATRSTRVPGTRTERSVADEAGVNRRRNAKADAAIKDMNEDELVEHRAKLQAERKDLERQRNKIRKDLRARGTAPDEADDGTAANEDRVAKNELKRLNNEIEQRRAGIDAVDKRLDNMPDEPAPAKKPAKKVVKKKAVKKVVKKKVPEKKPAPTVKEPSKPELRPTTPKSPTFDTQDRINARSEIDKIEQNVLTMRAEIDRRKQRIQVLEGHLQRARRDGNVRWQGSGNDGDIFQDGPPMIDDHNRAIAALEANIKDQEKEKGKLFDALAKPNKQFVVKKVVKKAPAKKKAVKKAVKKAPAKKAVKKTAPPVTAPETPDVTPATPNGAAGKPSGRPGWIRANVVDKDEIQVKSELDDYDAALAHLKAGGDIADIPDGVVLEAILNGGIEVKVQGQPMQTLSFEDLLNGNYFIPGAPNAMMGDGKRRRPQWTAENYRFKIKCVKTDDKDQFEVWHVFEVTDKTTGKSYFLKASQYGNHDAMLENIGADIMRAAGFPIDDIDGQIRVGREITGARGGKIRFSLQPHVKHLYGDKARNGERGDFNDWGHGAAHAIDPQDMARLAVADFLMDQEDRHGENVMVYVDKRGKKRIAVIDNGLGFGGRLGEQGRARAARADTSVAAMEASDFEAHLAKRQAYDPMQYALHAYNNFGGLRVRWTPEQRREARNEIARVVAKFEKLDVDAMFDATRLERRGMPLSDVERAHLDAYKRMFQARLKTLKRDANMDLLLDLI